MKYYSVTYKKDLNCNSEIFWSVLAKRFGDIGEISKGVLWSKYLTEEHEGIGTTRYCELPRNGFMKETVTKWNEPNEFEFEILESSMPMEKGGKLNFKVEQLGSENIRIQVLGTFRLKRLGLLSPLLKPALLKIIKRMINDFENEIKTKHNKKLTA